MKIKISQQLGAVVGLKVWKTFGLSDYEWAWRNGQTLDISALSVSELKRLEGLLNEHPEVRTTKVLARDVEMWRKATTNAGGTKARKVDQFAPLLKAYLMEFPGPWLYARGENDLWFAYYVEEISYTAPTKFNEAYVTMDLYHDDLWGRHLTSVRFNQSSCVGMTVAEALMKKGYATPTDELREVYDAEHEKFMETQALIGKQYLASGEATDDLDGNGADDDNRSTYWWRRETKNLNLVRDGEPTRVVIDVAYEGSGKPDKAKINTGFWKGKTDDEDEDAEYRAINIPVHHEVAVFDLRRHMRLKTHVENLVEYKYDTKISEKLVLPEHLKSIVQMLVEHKDVGFKDIVMGKSGGAVVLLAGPPGVGKTLTAEVFAENEQRALYSVQCSQLGTTASALEDELLKVFSRARRWNAVLLLDEADVYVHERGNDMEQNAIVSVFLRVLEYQTSVMFLTTNRPQDVDDAVLSRCLARLIYTHPNDDEQWKIWKVLAAQMGIIVDESVRAVFCDGMGRTKFSGRDIKNLLKLAILTSKGKGKITAPMVEFAKQFHPTIE